ncbi:MAG: phytanoyl-CoA dioxygenase family protein [Chloroflexota bacterium]
MANFKSIPAFYSKEDLDLAAFDAICQQTVELEKFPLAQGVEKNILIFDGDALREKLADADAYNEIKIEFARCLKDGPGVFVISKAYRDTAVIDASTKVLQQIVADEKAAGSGQGDHFGQNERIWNSIQKACVYAPELFIEYYSNPFLALACEAWLGPNYQITAQMNNVKPGSAAQSAHRDYHLGFQSRQTIKQYPAHAQIMSQYLTLQGAIAHDDMPMEMGPTLFLPFSQQYDAGYLAFREPEFAQYFDEHKVQIPFKKGDMVFFSPALFHGAGTNQTKRDRIANLVQISSAFGRPMETVNRLLMIETMYPILLDKVKRNSISDSEVKNTVAAIGDGYSFPTNLDSDPPVGGNAPETAQQMVHRALENRMPVEELKSWLMEYADRQKA